MDNPKIKYVVEDVEEEARHREARRAKEAAEKEQRRVDREARRAEKAEEARCQAAEKEARYEQEMENLNVEYAAISTNIMKGSVPPKPKNFSW